MNAHNIIICSLLTGSAAAMLLVRLKRNEKNGNEFNVMDRL